MHSPLKRGSSALIDPVTRRETDQRRGDKSTHENRDQHAEESMGQASAHPPGSSAVSLNGISGDDGVHYRSRRGQFMNADWSRRTILGAFGAAALTRPVSHATPVPGPRNEARETPKICLEAGAGSLATGGLDPAGMRRVKQLGVDHVLMGGPRIPWEEGRIRSIMDGLKAG